MAEEGTPKRSGQRRAGKGQETGAPDQPVGGEFTAGSGVASAFIAGNTFAAKPVTYSIVDGMAVLEGDIILGSHEAVQANSATLAAMVRGEIEAAVVITGSQFRWPNCTVPFDIDPALPDQGRVTDAIAHWEANSGFRFVQRTAANSATYPDWVTFRPSSGCSSSVGRQGGQQSVNLGPGCTAGNAIHEIGHTVGLWHEQSREDRDAFVTIHWDKIQPGLEHNFNQHITDGDDVGAYDYGSIMHYPRTAFSIDGSDTITPIQAGALIGQRTALSAGDIAAAATLCTPNTRKEHIETVQETVKERFETAQETVKEHLETVQETTKERFETVLETVKERIETAQETIKDRAETAKELHETAKELREKVAEGGGGTFVEGGPGGPGQPGQLGMGPGAFFGALPFALATPSVGLPGQAPADADADALTGLLAVEQWLAAATQAAQELTVTLQAVQQQLAAGLDALGIR